MLITRREFIGVVAVAAAASLIGKTESATGSSSAQAAPADDGIAECPHCEGHEPLEWFIECLEEQEVDQVESYLIDSGWNNNLLPCKYSAVCSKCRTQYGNPFTIVEPRGPSGLENWEVCAI